jgi:hypothetical protein
LPVRLRPLIGRDPQPQLCGTMVGDLTVHAVLDPGELGVQAVRATGPLTTCLRACGAYASSHERHQSSPHGDQTKRHSSSGEISAHRGSPLHLGQNGERVRVAL